MEGERTVTRQPVAKESFREKLAYLTYVGLTKIGRALPTHTGRMLFGWAGSLAFHLVPRMRRVVLANQAQVIGRSVDDPLVRASAKRAFRSYGRFWFDVFDMVGWPSDRFMRHFEFQGLEHVRQGLEGGKGVIVALPHKGNWDTAGRAMSEVGLPVVAVAEHLRPERLFELFLAHRRAMGMDVVGLTAEGKVGQQLASALSGNRVVALVADRDLTGRGIQIEMFGAPRKLPVGPAMLSLSTGAPVIVADTSQTKDGWRCIFHPPMSIAPTGDRRRDVTELTSRIAAEFERAIAAAPDDWHMFQPAWED